MTLRNLTNTDLSNVVLPGDIRPLCQLMLTLIINDVRDIHLRSIWLDMRNISAKTFLKYTSNMLPAHLPEANELNMHIWSRRLSGIDCY